MKRAAAIIMSACLAALVAVSAGCGKSKQNGGNKTVDAATAKKILDENIPLLTSDDKAKRIEAAKALGELGGMGKKAIPALITRMSDASEEADVVSAAQDALKKISDPEMVDALAGGYAAMRPFKEDSDKLRASLIALQGQMSDKDAEISKIKDRLDALAADKAAFDQKLADKDAALKTATDALAAANEAQAKAKADFDAANKKAADQQARIDTLTKEVADLKAAASSSGTQTQQMAADIQKAQADLAAAKQQLDAAMNAANAKDAQIKQLTDQVAQLQKQVADLQAENARLKAPQPPATP